MMRLGKTIVQIDADASQGGRNYPTDLFIHGDVRHVLEGLLARLPAKSTLTHRSRKALRPRAGKARSACAQA